MPEDRYKVSWLPAARDSLRELGQKARAVGLLDTLKQALTELNDRLEREPIEVGEIYRRRGPVEEHVAAHKLVGIDFGVDREKSRGRAEVLGVALWRALVTTGRSSLDRSRLPARTPRGGMVMSRRRVGWLLVLAAGLAAGPVLVPARDDSKAKDTLKLRLRSRVRAPLVSPAPKGKAATWTVVEKTAAWDPKKTALIICDMWDDHWCRSAARRVAEMAGPLDKVVAVARSRGVFIIHAPSTTTGYYKDTPQRKLAQAAPFAKPPIALSQSDRWGTAWCWPDGGREGVLPIDDSDMGCDCKVKCKIRDAWSRQIATLRIAAGDAITDNGQEAWNLLALKGIDNVILCGVHLTMCVLGRPFAIRQMVKLGKSVALMRDFTDTMYNPERPPGVNHFAGTDLVVAHVEQYWCPSFTSTDLTGKPPFRFKDAPKR
jgi:nicotinamidase-related amidase